MSKEEGKTVFFSDHQKLICLLNTWFYFPFYFGCAVSSRAQQPFGARVQDRPWDSCGHPWRGCGGGSSCSSRPVQKTDSPLKSTIHKDALK